MLSERQVLKRQIPVGPVLDSETRRRIGLERRWSNVNLHLKREALVP